MLRALGTISLVLLSLSAPTAFADTPSDPTTGSKVSCEPEAALEAPQDECANKSASDQQQGFFSDPGDATKTLVSWFGLVAALIGAFVVAVAILLLGITRLPKLRDIWPATRVRALEVSIEAFDDGCVKPEQGGTTAALVRSKIERFGRGGTMTMVDSKAAIEETVWTKVGAINDQAKTVSAVMEAIKSFYPRRQFQATGVLQPDGGAGHGLSIALRNGSEILGAATLWAQTFGVTSGKGDGKEIEPFQKIAVAAAAWISHVTAVSAGNDPGGSKDPVSWALFKVGGEWERDGNVEKATQAYREAIAIDPENWGARAELGKLEDEAHEYDDAVDHLRDSLKVLEK